MKTQGMKQQLDALDKMDGKRNFALLMEQGTGKTWTFLADAERCYEGDKIEALFVVAPTGVHVNWVRREIPTHMSIDCLTYAWRGDPKSKKVQAEFARLHASHYPVGERPLRVFAMGIDAVNTPKGFAAAEEFLKKYKTMMVVDESTRVKNPAAKRTEKVIALGRMATARRIGTGTPITKGPIDLFCQFDFLAPGLLGTKSYRAFVAEYAVLLPPNHPTIQAMIRTVGPKAVHAQVVATDAQGNKMWKNLDKLSSMIAPHSFRVRKEDCLDLPPKVYKQVYFELDAKQRRKYDDLKEDYNFIHDDGSNTSFEAIAARTKLKQVTSGFINIEGEPQLIEAKSNPRMAAFKEILEDINGQFIVWAIYEQEIKQIVAALEVAGISCVTYYGATGKEAREQAIDTFQAGRVQAFVANAQAAGIGLTLTAAETAIYYSCSYDNELRMQSEDRCHRIGTKHTVQYIDLVAEDTLDEDIVKSLATKTLVAGIIIDGHKPTEISGFANPQV